MTKASSWLSLIHSGCFCLLKEKPVRKPAFFPPVFVAWLLSKTSYVSTCSKNNVSYTEFGFVDILVYLSVLDWVGFLSGTDTWSSPISTKVSWSALLFSCSYPSGLWTIYILIFESPQLLTIMFSIFSFCFRFLSSDIMDLAVMQIFSRITLLYRASNKASLINFSWSCVPFDSVKAKFSRTYLIFDFFIFQDPSI